MQTTRNYCVYIHFNTKDKLKAYVGQTKVKPERRFGKNGVGYKACPYFWRAIQKYGWDAFEHEIFKSGLCKEEADRYEQRLIAMLGSNDPALGYNLASGGRGAPDNPSKVRPVVLFDLNGKRIMEFSSTTLCAAYLGVNAASVSDHLSSRKGTIAGHICHYAENVEGIEQLPPAMVFQPNEQRAHWKRVSAYTLTGDFVATFSSIKEASLHTGIPSAQISGVLAGRRNSAHGFQFRYGQQDTGMIAAVPPKGLSLREGNHYAAREILQYQHDTCELVCRYPSIVSASMRVGCGQTTLLHALKGDHPTAAGFIWRYADDSRPVKPVRLAPIHTHDNPSRKPRRVQQLDVHSGAVLAEFPSLSAAARCIGVAGSAIYASCTGKTQTSAGYHWRFCQ